MADLATRTDRGAEMVVEAGGARDRFWYVRAWDGMTLGASLRLLAKNRFAVAPSRVPMALIILLLGPFHSALGLFQRICFGRKIARTEIRQAPVFIVGHWRSGTTLLHELLCRDRRHTYPTTYDCFAPAHFLVSSSFLPPFVRHVMPSMRPMDAMALGLDRPQEDEFALCNLGVPSPYWTIAFPNRPPQYQEYLTLETLSPGALQRWQRSFRGFLQALTCRRPKRLVLKSPPHTGRIRTLVAMFPDARFVHIVRDPYVLYPSTVSLWRRLYRQQGFQVPRYEDLSDLVFDSLMRMYGAFWRDEGRAARVCRVRYEDLVADPLGQVERVYDELGLGPFGPARPAMEQYLALQAGYRPNRYELPAPVRDEITRRWRAYIDTYGYARP